MGEMGSQLHARLCRQRQERIVGAICLEMLGYFTDELGSQRLPDTSFLRSPHYHVPTDTPETLDYKRMAEVSLGVAGAVCFLAGLQGRFNAAQN